MCSRVKFLKLLYKKGKPISPWTGQGVKVTLVVGRGNGELLLWEMPELSLYFRSLVLL